MRGLLLECKLYIYIYTIYIYVCMYIYIYSYHIFGKIDAGTLACNPLIFSSSVRQVSTTFYHLPRYHPNRSLHWSHTHDHSTNHDLRFFKAQQNQNTSKALLLEMSGLFNTYFFAGVQKIKCVNLIMFVASAQCKKKIHTTWKLT